MKKSVIRRNLVDTTFGQMHYRMAGEGDALVLLHQVPLSSMEFSDVQPMLALNHRTIAPDLLGYGYSDQPNSGITMADYADSIISLMDDLRIEKTDLLGIHTGASVATEIAAAYPDRIRKLIIVGVPFWDSWQERYENFARCQPFHLDAEGQSIKYQWERLLLYTDQPRIIQSFITEKLKASPLWYTAYVAVFTYDFKNRFDLIKAPTMFLGGENDFLADHTTAFAALHPEVQLKTIKDASVWPTWEQPKLFVEGVESFLSE